MPIIKSILDNDFYAFTQQNAITVYLREREAIVKYDFTNRRPEGKFNDNFANAFHDEIDTMSALVLQPNEAAWLRDRVPWLGTSYLEYLRNYRYDPKEISFVVKDGELQLEINGTWERTILWEVPLMALISELFFKHCDTNWTMEGQTTKAESKRHALEGIPHSDFGTRRRRNYDTQDILVETLKQSPSFMGTSNVHFAMKHNVRTMGTQAHQWYMAISALESLRRANHYGMKLWHEIYQGRLGIALTDTFGSDAFFKDFDLPLAELYDGVRHDSGPPLAFAKKAISHYEQLGIDPKTKTIIFSDSLNCSVATSLYDTLKDQIKVSFGIGTDFTNSFSNSPALNIVIKMWSCNHIPVVKLSDVPSKEIGDCDALRVARWTFRGQALDSKQVHPL